MIFVVSQKQADLLNPKAEDLFEYGTICTVEQFGQMPQGGIRILVDGKMRGRIVEFTETNDYFEANIEGLGGQSAYLSNPQDDTQFLLGSIHRTQKRTVMRKRKKMQKRNVESLNCYRISVAIICDIHSALAFVRTKLT